MLNHHQQPILISKEEINTRVTELAAKINATYTNQSLILIGVLKGGFIFLADLARRLSIPLQIDFIEVSSYGDATRSSGQVKLRRDISRPLQGENLLLVEDIVDRGETLRFLIDHLNREEPATLRVASLLTKKVPSDLNIDFRGFEIEDHFVVGYGMDAGGKYRELDHIAIYEPSDERPLET